MVQTKRAPEHGHGRAMAVLHACLIPLFASALGCGEDASSADRGMSNPDGAAEASAQDAGDASAPDAAGPYRLEVTRGHGSGTYPEGAIVHVSSDLSPTTQFLTSWSGDVALLERPKEWHTTLTMPARDVTIEANIETRTEALEVTSFLGTTTYAKTIRSYAPANPRGLVLLLHGTGGSSALADKGEARYLLSAAIARGYAVLAPEAEEVAQGDMNADGKVRWDVSLTPDNVDLANLNELIAVVRDQGTIGSTTPLYVVGMSNGGAMSLSLGAVSASAVSSSFANLRFAAAVSYCASGRAAAAAATTTPTAWYLCANDDNDEVSNDEAKANSATLASRGIATEVDAHAASPLYDMRFTRVDGVTAASSQGIADELRAGGFVGADGLFDTPTDAIAASVQANPAAFPVISSTPSGRVSEVVNQLRVMQAEHEMFSDWAVRTMDFLEANEP